MQIYCDLDGVLADLDTHYKNLFGIEPSILLDNLDWNLVRDSANFYEGIPLMPDAMDLWNYIAPFRPIILTGVPKSVEEASQNKRNWVARHFGADVKVRCVRSSEKYLSAQRGDVLIDDWEKYRNKWEKAGGVWITHCSAAQTIGALEEQK